LEKQLMMDLRRFLVVVAASLPLAGQAQTPPAAPPAAPLVQVYGTLNVNLQYTGAESATTVAQNVKPRFAISIDSSNIGVRGTADVAGGLKAVYQCETQASVEGEDLRALCGRNSRVGLSGDFGTLFYGNWDTPFKAGTYGTNADDPFGNTDVFTHAAIMASPGYGVRSTALGTAAAANAGFDARAGNSLAYWSPKFSGVSAKVQVGVDEFASATGTVRPSLVSGVVNFDTGGLSLVGQVEYREDYYGIRTASGANAGTTASKDMAFRLAAGYALPLGDGTLTVLGWFEQLSYGQDDATTGFKSYSRPAYLVGAKYKMGEHEFRVRYSAALKPSITAATGTVLAANAEDDLGAQNIAVGYAYNLAKTTQVYLFYTQVMNEDRARYTFGVSGAAAVVGAATPIGSDPSALGLGIRQSF
jgi:predicted porin